MHAPSCSRCDATYDVDEWRGLPLVERLDRQRVADLLSEWPWSNDAVLELRRCRCGQELASLRELTAATEPHRSEPRTPTR